MSTLFSLFSSTSISKTGAAGSGNFILVLFAALLAVGIIFVALPMLGLGVATAETLSAAFSQ